jgi:hypothetical protein
MCVVFVFPGSPRKISLLAFFLLVKASTVQKESQSQVEIQYEKEIQVEMIFTFTHAHNAT